MKLTLQRNLYGIHAPVRLLMERKIVSRVSDCLNVQVDCH